MGNTPHEIKGLKEPAAYEEDRKNKRESRGNSTRN